MRSLTTQEHLRCQEFFFEMDPNRDGVIELSELKQALEERAEIPADEALRIFSALDSNKDERISYAEFLAAMVTTRIEIDDDHIAQTFNRFDSDRSGYITADDLQEVLGDSIDRGEVENLLAEGDYDGDGFISLSEFTRFIACGSPEFRTPRLRWQVAVKKTINVQRACLLFRSAAS